MNTDSEYIELIKKFMQIQLCGGIICGTCLMHTDSASFKNKYGCSCIFVAIGDVIEESGVDYDGK